MVSKRVGVRGNMNWCLRERTLARRIGHFSRNVSTSATCRERPECAVFIATSIDGYIARKCGSLDWLDPVQDAASQAGDDLGYKAFYGSVDAIVMGRNTYDTVKRFPEWPYSGKRCLVLSHRELGDDLPEGPAGPCAVEACAGEPAQILKQIWNEGVRRVYIDGGATIQQFQAAGLLDELIVSVAPVMLGTGIPLFREGSEQQFQFISSCTSITGLVQIKWRSVRA